MIIDSHEHVMIPLETQVSKLCDAHIDKAILFCTLPHPEQATTLAELTQEMKGAVISVAGQLQCRCSA